MFVKYKTEWVGPSQGSSDSKFDLLENVTQYLGD